MSYYDDYGVFEGLTKVDEVYLSEPDYSFYLLGIWRGDDGYYISTDSGCSCPTPWESHTQEDLTGPLNAEHVREEARSLWDGYDRESFEDTLDAL